MAEATTEKRTARLTPASGVKMQRQRELLAQRIPLGTVSLVAGYAGEGKSSWLVHITALASRGNLDGDLAATIVPTVWVNIEDDPGRVQVPRLTAAGADLDHVFFLTIDSTVDEHTRETIPSLPMDVEVIRAALIQSSAKLMILDPASSLMSGDLNKREDARRSLDALSALAQELDIAIVLVMHLSKGRGKPSEKISGSHALRDAVRSVLLVARDDETDQRIITCDKSNYGPHVGKSWAFGMIDAEVLTVEGEVLHIGRVIDLGETEMNVSDIINRDVDSDDDDRSEADRWLVAFLEAEGGSAKAADVKRRSGADGLSWDSIKRASRKTTEKAKSGFQGSWVWTLNLTEGSTKGAKGAGAREPAPFAPFAAPLNREAVITPFPGTTTPAEMKP